MLVRGTNVDQLISAETLYLWTATLAFVLSQGFIWFTPDPLVSSFMIALAVLLVNVQASFSGYKVMGMEGVGSS